MTIEPHDEQLKHWKHKFEDLDREYQKVQKKCHSFEQDFHDMKRKYEQAHEY